MRTVWREQHVGMGRSPAVNGALGWRKLRGSGDTTIAGVKTTLVSLVKRNTTESSGGSRCSHHLEPP